MAVIKRSKVKFKEQIIESLDYKIGNSVSPSMLRARKRDFL